MRNSTKINGKKLLMKTKVPAIFIGVACCFLIVALFQQYPMDLRGSDFPHQPFQDAPQIPLLWSNSCGLPLSFVYVKTHKTGSSSLMGILQKYLKTRRLQNQTKFAAVPGPFVGGYPGKFKRDFCVLEGNETLTNGVRVDFLAAHLRFREDEIQKVMNPRALYTTIVRNPLKQFESSFYYYYGRYNSRTPRSLVICHLYPYIHLTKGQKVNFPEYMKLADEFLNESVPWFFRSRNYQAFDLGIDPLNLNEEYVLGEVKKLDENFHLVLVLDYFYESLVLLKDLFCMEWQDIVLEQPKQRGSYKAHTFTEKEKEIVAKLTTQDQILYNYFNASLWRKIERYGHERMKRDVATLQKLMEKPKNEMRAKQLKLNLSIRARTTRSTKPRLREEIKNQLLKKKLRPKDELFAEKIGQYMTENYGLCPV